MAYLTKDPKLKPVIILALITAVSLFGDSMLYVALPTHFREAGLVSLVQVGVLLSVNRFVRLPLNPLIGWAYRKMSSRTGILTAVMIAGLTTFLYGQATNFYVWCAIRSVWGLAWSLLRLGSYFLILDLSTDNNRGHYLGTFNGLYRIGSLVGMLAGGLFVDLYGLSSVTTVFSVFAFLAVPFVVKYIPHTKHASAAEGQKASKGAILRHPFLLWVLCSVFLAAMSLEGMLTATLSHLIETHARESIHLLGITLGAATIAGILQAARWSVGPAVSPAIGKLSDGRLGRVPLIAGGLILISVCMALSQIHLPLSVWLILLLMILLISTALTTVTDALSSDLATGSLKVAVATVYVITLDVGAAFGPILAYACERIVGLRATYFGSSMILFSLGIVWSVIAYSRWMRRQENGTVKMNGYS